MSDPPVARPRPQTHVKFKVNHLKHRGEIESDHGIYYTKDTITSYHSSFANIPIISCTRFANTPITCNALRSAWVYHVTAGYSSQMRKKTRAR